MTLSGQRQYILAVIEHATRRIRVPGATTHPAASWVAQVARNLVMDLEDAGRAIRYLIRDRDGKFCAALDDVLADAGSNSTSLQRTTESSTETTMRKSVQFCSS